ncbi:calmodulin-binding protein [Pelomyxa schiedti]|nr:calmodulin-binding protein [Pelomyxa schiedti]
MAVDVKDERLKVVMERMGAFIEGPWSELTQLLFSFLLDFDPFKVNFNTESNALIQQANKAITLLLKAEKQAYERANHRKAVLDELCSTEEDYLKDLKIMSEIWQPKLVQAGIFSSSEVKLLFGNLPQLSFLSAELLEAFKKAKETPVLDQRLGQSFSKMIPYIRLYGEYAQSRDKATEIIGTARKNHKYVTLVEKTRPLTRNLDLPDFLIKPAQRIFKYPLLLNDLIKDTTPDHPDYTNLVEASEKMKKVLDDINEATKAHQTRTTILALQPNISWINTVGYDLLNSKLTLLLSDKIKFNLSAPEEDDQRGNMVYLFDICMLLTHHRSGKWQEIATLMLQDCSLDESGAENLENSFSITSKSGIKVVFKFEDGHSRQHWVTIMSAALSKIPTDKVLLVREISKNEDLSVERKPGVPDLDKSSTDAPESPEMSRSISRTSLDDDQQARKQKNRLSLLIPHWGSDGKEVKKDSDIPVSVPPPAPPPPPLIHISPLLKKTPATTSESQTTSDSTVPPPEQPSPSPNSTPTPPVEPVDPAKAAQNKRLNHRKAVLEELCSTEEDYLRDLKIMLEIWQPELLKANLLTTQSAGILFRDIAQFQALSQELLDLFTAQKITPVLDQKIGEIFKLRIPFLKVYIEFAQSRDKAGEIMNSLRKNHKYIGLVERLRPQTKFLELPDFLIKPAQRIVKYPLLLNDLIKHTDADHPDYTNLIAAAEQTRKVLDDINESTKAHQTINVLRILQPNLTWTNTAYDLISSKLNLILGEKIKCSLIKAESETKGNTAYLFDLILLLCRQRIGKWQEIATFMLQDCSVDEESELDFTVCNKNGCKLLFKPSDSHTRQMWLSSINNAIANIPSNKTLILKEVKKEKREQDSDLQHKNVPSCVTPPLSSSPLESDSKVHRPSLESIDVTGVTLEEGEERLSTLCNILANNRAALEKVVTECKSETAMKTAHLNMATAIKAAGKEGVANLLEYKKWFSEYHPIFKVKLAEVPAAKLLVTQEKLLETFVSKPRNKKVVTILGDMRPVVDEWRAPVYITSSLIQNAIKNYDAINTTYEAQKTNPVPPKITWEENLLLLPTNIRDLPPPVLNGYISLFQEADSEGIGFCGLRELQAIFKRLDTPKTLLEILHMMHQVPHGRIDSISLSYFCQIMVSHNISPDVIAESRPKSKRQTKQQAAPITLPPLSAPPNTPPPSTLLSAPPSTPPPLLSTPPNTPPPPSVPIGPPPLPSAPTCPPPIPKEIPPPFLCTAPSDGTELPDIAPPKEIGPPDIAPPQDSPPTSRNRTSTDKTEPIPIPTPTPKGHIRSNSTSSSPSPSPSPFLLTPEKSTVIKPAASAPPKKVSGIPTKPTIITTSQTPPVPAAVYSPTTKPQTSPQISPQTSPQEPLSPPSPRQSQTTSGEVPPNRKLQHRKSSSFSERTNLCAAVQKSTGQLERKSSGIITSPNQPNSLSPESEFTVLLVAHNFENSGPNSAALEKSPSLPNARTRLRLSASPYEEEIDSGETVCKNCGSMTPIRAQFCQNCGKPRSFVV